jgi:hypothetical protein
VLKLERSVYYYRSRKDPQTELRVRLKDLAAARVAPQQSKPSITF